MVLWVSAYKWLHITDIILYRCSRAGVVASLGNWFSLAYRYWVKLLPIVLSEMDGQMASLALLHLKLSTVHFPSLVAIVLHVDPFQTSA